MATSAGLGCDDARTLLKKRAQARLDQLRVSEPRRKTLGRQRQIRRTRPLEPERIAEEPRLESESQSREQQTPPANKRDRFSKLPAEIRNVIYELVLSGENDERPLGLTTRLPAIVNVSRQTLRESLTMWLGNNDFVVHVRRTNSTKDPRTDPGYCKVLDWLDWISPACVKFIRSLTIILEDHDYMPCNKGRRHPDWALKDIWTIFVAELANRGLLPHQLRWPGLSEEQLTDMVKMSQADNNRYLHEARQTVREQARFQLRILVPNLIKHELFDVDRPPTNIYEQAAERFDGMQLGNHHAAWMRRDEKYYKPENCLYHEWADTWRPCPHEICQCSATRCCSGGSYCF